MFDQPVTDPLNSINEWPFIRYLPEPAADELAAATHDVVWTGMGHNDATPAQARHTTRLLLDRIRRGTHRDLLIAWLTTHDLTVADTEPAHTQITIPWAHGDPLVGTVQILDEGPFAGTALVADPYDHIVRAYRDHHDNLDLQAEAAWWRKPAERGAIHPGDVEAHNAAHRQAMADWWSAAVDWIETHR